MIAAGALLSAGLLVGVMPPLPQQQSDAELAAWVAKRIHDLAAHKTSQVR